MGLLKFDGNFSLQTYQIEDVTIKRKLAAKLTVIGLVTRLVRA
jgi:hypothetical protein